jgi:beta-phosphoglucomutase
MKKYKAFLFDLNGTMIDDMHYHLKVWHRVVTELGGNLTEDQVKKEMYGKNQDLLNRVFGEGKFTEEEMEEISLRKERMYQELFLPELKLIDGLSAFLQNAFDQEILMAIGSAAIPFNINFVLDNLKLHDYFKAIVSAKDVEKSKPDPETYIKAAKLLDVPLSECLVFEDAPKGVEAAENAEMDCVCIKTMHEEHEFQQYKNIILYVDDYNDNRLKELL